jgi:hypothetical protein
MPEKKDFIIKDKRIFAEEDKEKKKEDEKAEPSKEEAEDQVPEEEAVKEEAEKEADEKDYPLPVINFSTFIFSLNSSALMQLGIIDDPASGKKIKNLPLAKQTIDILGMLEEKTRGNLTEDEENMLKNILYDLRMVYVKMKE